MALWLARRGLRVLALDISPEGLRLCRERAAAAGLELELRTLDLEREPPPEGPFEVITCAFYLQRDLFPRLQQRLVPGGVLVCELPTVRNLERHAHPSPQHLVGVNELLTLVAPLEIVAYREGWLGERAIARVLARRTP